MHLPIQYLATLIIVIINFITFWTMAKGSGHFVTNGDSIIVGRCIKRQKQIICPMGKSHLARLHQATSSNSSLELGPNMYHRRFTISNIDSAIARTPIRPVAKSKTHVIYYTKQYDDHHHSSSSSSSSPVDHNGGDQNVFDFSDEEEHEFMHEPKIEENVIDDGHQVKKINKDKIKMFIDENKSMIRRMFGDYQYNQMEGEEAEEEEELIRDHYSSFHDGPDWKRRRPKRSIKPTPLSGNKVDSCESSVEIVTPYWASNSAGKIRAIVNTQHLQQAIQQEVCQAVQTRRCNKDCRCEQKYKWHRLLAYDPDDDCKGIFMDWFLFPSCCVCRCIKY